MLHLLIVSHFFAGMLVLTGIAGPGFWVYHLFSIGDYEIRPNHIAFAFTIVFSLITVGQNFIKVLNLNNRAMPLLPTVLQLIPFSILILLSTIWAATEHQLLEDSPHVLLMTLSLIFAYLTSRLIVNRVCKEPTQHFHGILVPLIVVAFAGLVGAAMGVHSAAMPLAVTLLVISGLQFFFFSVCIILQLTNHLGIHAFTITPVDPSSRPPVTPQRGGTGVPLLQREESSESLEIHVEDGAHSIE